MAPNHFNLVFSRSCDGDHTALQRWYSDHIGILWRCDSLQRATLYRRDADVAHEADYICCYAFPDEAGFLNYEHGDAREAARLVIVNGWGKEGIAITQRRQYRREWSRQNALATGAIYHTVLCLALGAGPWDGVSRWLVDRVHTLLGQGASAVTLMRAVEASDAGGEVVLFVASDQPLPAELAWLDNRATDVWGQPPASLVLNWRWAGRVVADWTR
ncbi:hypothetical protein [Hydrogenophaga atypica]|uniref:Uncharacterized protein n=1 Tax=Hydrogenophaga atypica TaxID=249409 RepID=A0ABW2QJQ1_9BURK